MIFGFSKTSIAGVLSFLVATLTTLTAFQVPAAFAPGGSKILLIVTTVANLIVALCRVWIGLLENDAPPSVQK